MTDRVSKWLLVILAAMFIVASTTVLYTPHVRAGSCYTMHDQLKSFQNEAKGKTEGFKVYLRENETGFVMYALNTRYPNLVMLLFFKKDQCGDRFANGRFWIVVNINSKITEHISNSELLFEKPAGVDS